MTVLFEAFFLAAMVVAAIFAGSEAWSKEALASPPVDAAASRSTVAIEDRSFTIVIRPAVNLQNKKERAEAATGELTLAEIVDAATIPAGERETVMRHLKSVGLTDRPGVGEERAFSQEGLETIVAEASRRLEAAGYEVEWKIPNRTHVVCDQAFNRESVSAQLQSEFEERCVGCDVIIGRIDWPQTAGLKIRSWKLSMRGDKPRGSFAVPLELDLADETGRAAKKNFMVTGQVEFFARVPVATRAVPASEKLAAGDYKIERKNVTYVLDAAADVKDFETSVASRGLTIGESIWKSSLRREQLVRFGDPVRVQVGGETWSITSEGVAQGPAALGESVRVKVGKTQKLVSGILKEKGLVEIQ